MEPFERPVFECSIQNFKSAKTPLDIFTIEERRLSPKVFELILSKDVTLFCKKVEILANNSDEIKLSKIIMNLRRNDTYRFVGLVTVQKSIILNRDSEIRKPCYCLIATFVDTRNGRKITIEQRKINKK